MKPLLLTCLLFVNFFYLIAQPVSVLTQRYDNRRLSWNPNERKLDTSNVNTTTFGFRFSRPVDDQIYGQPLIVSGLTINNQYHNIVFVATVNNSVYAFDADNDTANTPIWRSNLTPVGARVIQNADMTGACGGNYKDFSGNIGIVGTPVIDTFTHAIYLVSRDITLDSIARFEQYIHALDIYTGQEKPGSPSLITASYPGNGDGNANDTVYFDEQKQNQRPALLLLNREIYVCWASHCDWQNYHGWVIGFDDSTLTKKHVYNTSADGYEAGIWMSGSGPCVDDNGYIYLVTGNGAVGQPGNENYTRNRGESLLKLKPDGDTLAVVDFYTPSNYQYLENNDLDYGSDGTIIIPNTKISVSGTKDGLLYLVNTDHMGRYTPGDDSLVQTLYANAQNIFPRSVHGTPMYYSYNNGQTECVYVWAASDSLRQFFFDRGLGRVDTTRTIVGNNIRLDQGTPGAMLTISSQGQIPGSGVLWAYHTISGDANQSVRPGQIDAYDATNVNRLLWTSQMNPTRDSVGNFAKFNHPVVANGKVYVPTFSNLLMVYGLFHPPFDTLIDMDTTVIRDTVHLDYNIIIRDTVHTMGSITVRDTARTSHIYVLSDTSLTGSSLLHVDSVHSTDTIIVMDTLHIHDTIYVRDTLRIIDSIPTPSGLGNIKDQLNVELYPNPASDLFILSYDMPPYAERVSMALLDMYGRMDMNISFSNSPGRHMESIDISGQLPSGVYMLILDIDGRWIKIGKLIKE